MEIHNISLRAFVQATESEERVRTALSLFLSGNEIEAVSTEGHYGNPIIILQVRMKGKSCSGFIELLRSKLTASELERLKKEADERVDEDCVLHVRLDKQAAYKGAVQLAAAKDAISAEIKLRAYPARRENAIEVAEKIF